MSFILASIISKSIQEVVIISSLIFKDNETHKNNNNKSLQGDINDHAPKRPQLSLSLYIYVCMYKLFQNQKYNDIMFCLL